MINDSSIQVYKYSHQAENITIRLATKKDIPQIIAIQLAALKVLAVKDYQPDQLQVLLASKSKQRSRFETIFIAEIELRIIGFAALDRFSNSLSGLFVDPEYTRRGVGTKLLQRVEQEAKKLKIPILWVCASLTGYPFYLANNYQEIASARIHLYGVKIPCVQMKKRLLVLTLEEQIKDILYQAVMWLLMIWLLISIIVKF